MTRRPGSQDTQTHKGPSPRTPDAPLIRVENLAAGYDQRPVIENVNFAVTRGQIVAIVGGSGCGKSTLLNSMIGLLPAMTGAVWIDGRNLLTAADAERRQILSSFGVAFQSGALFGSMTALENVSLPLEEFTDLPAEAIAWIATAKLRLVGLEGFEGYKPSELSGGMCKRTALARAMALDPKILFLDEPSAGLDPVTAAHLDRLILQLSRGLGVTCVMVTHELASIFALADWVIFLDKTVRGILAQGRPLELSEDRTHPAVRQFFHRAADDMENLKP
jgi:phospholipid/cholesterol/gamma-HCH transport system ATP-binding protein